MNETKWLVGWYDNDECGGIGVSDSFAGGINLVLDELLKAMKDPYEPVELTAGDVVEITNTLTYQWFVDMSDFCGDAWDISFYLEEIPYVKN